MDKAILFCIITMEVKHYNMDTYTNEDIDMMIDKIYNPDVEFYRDTFVNPEKDFTRKRKISLGELFALFVNNTGGTQNKMLRDMFGLADDRPSASAYIQARGKTTLTTYERLWKDLFDFDRVGWTLLRDKYKVLDFDGYDINICPDRNDEETTVVLANNPNDRQCNQIHTTVASSFPDGIILDYVNQPARLKDENSAFLEMLGRLKPMLESAPVLALADRGFESYRNMMYCESEGYNYCFRFKDITSVNGIARRYAEFCDEEGCFDIDVCKKYTRCKWLTEDPIIGSEYIYVQNASKNPFVPESPNSVGRPANGTKPEPSFYEFSFRLVRFKLSEESYEVIATNLSRKEFTPEDLKALYHCRWQVETEGRKLKYDDNLVYFHTKKREYSIFEIIMSLVFHNICSLFIMVNSSVIDEKINSKHREDGKQREYYYKASYSDMADAMRHYFPMRGSPGINEKMVGELVRTVQPVRENRKFPRFLMRKLFKPFLYRVA